MRLALKLAFVLVLLLPVSDAGAVWAQGRKYPPLSEHMMAPEAEVALARSAAPDKVSGRATIKILTASGYQVAVRGDNGFVCMVMRSWTAPTFTPVPFRNFVYEAKIRAPICFDPVASRTVMPYYELRTKLGMQGNDPETIARGVAMAYALGTLPKREGVAFGYMWSADQYLGPGIGAWRPHMMVFAPYYKNAMVGGNEFGGSAPQVTDDEGTPFTVIVIPVHGNPAIRAKAAGARSLPRSTGSIPSVTH
ncbi:MAG: hypothetical protein ACT4PY_16550 [Armatimonadota bacterium]